MAVQSIIVLSGAGVSSAFMLIPPVGLWSLHVPSMSGAAGGVRMQFATSSAGTDFATLWDPNAQDVLVHSSAVRPAIAVFQPATPWARIAVQNSVSFTASFTVLPVRG